MISASAYNAQKALFELTDPVRTRTVAIDRLSSHTVFDAWFAGDEGSQILKSAKKLSIHVVKSQEQILQFRR
jgi:hypothetical protein